MDGPVEYESDFVGWTERQAALLRALPQGMHGLDTAQLAEEVEDLGRAEIRAASSLLRQVLIHMIKLAIEPNAPAANHWIDEILSFQADALLASSAGIRQRIDLDFAWRQARRRTHSLRSERRIAAEVLPASCPFTLDELLAEDFDPTLGLQKLQLAMRALQR